MASPSGNGGHPPTSGEGHQSSVPREEDTVIQSTGGVAISTIPSLVGLVGTTSSSSEHRAVPFEGDGSRTAETGPRAAATESNLAEISGDVHHTETVGGTSSSMGGTSGPIGGDPSTMIGPRGGGSTLASGAGDDRPTRGGSVAMQGGESTSGAMEIDVPGMGAQVSEVEMDIGSEHVMVEQRSAGEGADTGSQESLVPSDLLSASLVTEVPIGGEDASVVVLVIRRDLGKEKVIVEEARDSSSGGEDMEVGASDPVVVPAAVGSSRTSGYTMADTLEGVRDEDLTRTLQEDPTFAEVIAEERVLEHVQDMFF